MINSQAKIGKYSLNPETPVIFLPKENRILKSRLFQNNAVDEPTDE